MRSTSSPAARSVKVMARMRSGATPALQHRAAEALHQHARLAGARARVDEDGPRRADGPLLVGVELHAGQHLGAHRGTRQTPAHGQKEGQEPPRGSWRTSPRRMRATRRVAMAWASAMAPSKSGCGRTSFA